MGKISAYRGKHGPNVNKGKSKSTKAGQELPVHGKHAAGVSGLPEKPVTQQTEQPKTDAVPSAKKSKAIGAIILCNLFLSLTVIFFQPLDYMLLNLGEFLVSFENVWWVQLLIAIGATVVLSAVMLLLPVKAGRIAASVSLGFGLAFLAQTLLFNDGKVLRMNTNWPIEVLNIFVWFGIVAITVSMGAYYSGEQGRRAEIVMFTIACLLIVAQAYNFTILSTLVDTTESVAGEKGHYLSREGEFTLGKENNTIVFVLENTDDFYFKRMLKKHPEIKEQLAGWVHYTNTTSEYSKTYPSISYLLTGEKCYFDREAGEYIEKAFENGYLKQLYNQGTDVRVFTLEPAMVGENSDGYITNWADHQLNQAKRQQTEHMVSNMMRVSMIRCLPFHMKLLFNDEGKTVNGFPYKDYEAELAFADYTDPQFYETLNNSGINLSDQYSDAFRFYHIWGTRSGYTWAENLTEAEGAAPENALAGSFMMIDAYITKMKEQGVYDQATIIVMGDHGFSGGGTEDLTVSATACPMLVVKYPNADDSQPLIANEAPVSQEDLFATIEKALGADVSGCGSGKTLRDIGEEDERKREYFYTAFYAEEDGEIALRKYIIDGPADKITNWYLTDEWWNIQYSMNKVSENRFTGE